MSADVVAAIKALPPAERLRYLACSLQGDPKIAAVLAAAADTMEHRDPERLLAAVVDFANDLLDDLRGAEPV